MVIEAQRALQLVPPDLHIFRAQGGMLGARLRQLAACTLHIALLLVNHRKLILRLVPERVGLGGSVLDRGPSLVCILPVALVLRPSSKTRVRIGRAGSAFTTSWKTFSASLTLTSGLQSLSIESTAYRSDS